jgi:Dna[CI] antecedent DciA-like protein
VPRRASSDFISMDELARGAGGPSMGDPALSRLAVFSAWGKAVGETILAVTRPSSYSRGGLEIEILDAAWTRPLEDLRPEILGRLGELLPDGSVSRIRFHVRRGPSRPRAPARRVAGAAPAVPIRRSDLPASEETAHAVPDASAVSIRDEGLRAHFQQVARRYLFPRD